MNKNVYIRMVTAALLEKTKDWKKNKNVHKERIFKYIIQGAHNKTLVGIFYKAHRPIHIDIKGCPRYFVV